MKKEVYLLFAPISFMPRFGHQHGASKYRVQKTVTIGANVGFILERSRDIKSYVTVIRHPTLVKAG
jgi:hypothetical protein